MQEAATYARIHTKTHFFSVTIFPCSFNRVSSLADLGTAIDFAVDPDLPTFTGSQSCPVGIETLGIASFCWM